MGTNVVFSSELEYEDLIPNEYTPARVLRAYFAQKAVTVEDGNTSVEFEEINNSILGKIVYLIVETEGMQGQNLQVAVRSNAIQTLSSTQMLRGSTSQQTDDIAEGALQLMRFNAGEYAAANVFDVVVGNLDVLNNNQGECEYTNLDDHANRAIIKLRLCPDNRAAFDRWARDIGGRSGDIWQILVQFSDDIGTETFDTLRVENRSFYEIYGEIERNQLNPFNFLPVQNGNRRKIGHVRNNSSDLIVYFYYDQYGQETRIPGEFTRITVMGRNEGVSASRPTNFLRREAGPAAADGTERWNYFLENAHNRELEDIVTTDGSTTRRYNASGIYVDLIRMPDNFQPINICGTTIAYTFSNTLRRYCSPGLFAAFIGVLGQYGYSVRTTGVSFRDATGFPSFDHVNGISIDIPYRGSGRNDNDIRIVGAFRDWGFERIIVGFSRRSWLYGNNLAQRHDPNPYPRVRGVHDGHFHAGNFNANNAIDNII